MLVFVGFHIHRVLEMAFHEVFVAPIAPLTVRARQAEDDILEPIDVETPAMHDGHHEPAAAHPNRAPAAANGAEPANDQTTEEAVEGLWRILEERVATLRYPNRERDPANRAQQRSESD